MSGQSWRWATADEVRSADPATHRFLIGTPGSSELIAATLRELGATLDGNELRYGDILLLPGEGLLVQAPDPDGGGTLVLFAGLDDPGVESCFSVPFDRSRPGTTVARRGIIRTSSLWNDADTTEPAFVRLDQTVDEVLTGPGSTAEQAALLRARLEPHREVLLSAGVDPWDTLAANLPAQGRAHWKEAHDLFADGDLEAEIRHWLDECEVVLGPLEGPRPLYFLLYAPPARTNAMNFGQDWLTGRRKILLNLCRLTEPGAFEAAVIHETLHAFQDLSARYLLERAVAEGVACFLTQETLPGISDHAALMWTEDELHRAHRLEPELVKHFQRFGGIEDPVVAAQYMVLGRAPVGLPGAPSRTGYYVGWRAAGEWHAAHPHRPLSSLLSVPAEQVFAALTAVVDE